MLHDSALSKSRLTLTLTLRQLALDSRPSFRLKFITTLFSPYLFPFSRFKNCDFIIYTYFPHTLALSTVTDDVKNQVTHKIFHINLYYSNAYFYLKFD